MARKHSADHQRYQPVDEAFIRSVPFAIGPVGQPDQDENLHITGIENKPPSFSPPKTPTLPESDDDIEIVADETEKRSISKTTERLDKPLKFRLPRSERSDVMRIVNRLGEQVETSVEWSHVGRALVVLLRHAESEIVKHARRNGPLIRPSNDQAIALAEYEQRIAQILLRAFREVAPLR
jgi:hypothetical protein